VCEEPVELSELVSGSGATEPATCANAPAEGAEKASAGARRPHWRQLLSGSSPREVLARLLNGDPLGLAGVVAERLRARAYVLDADRVLLRALARCARFALRYRGQPELEAWLSERVDEALLDLQREDLEAERSGRPAEPHELAAFEDLASPLGLEPAAMRGVCVRFNLLAEGERRAFFALALEGRSLDLLAREWNDSATEIARRARRALEALLASSAPPASPTSSPAAPDSPVSKEEPR